MTVLRRVQPAPAAPPLGEEPIASPSPTAAGHPLALESITHRFGAVTAVDDVSLAIGAGELVAFLGPSGCGKTTLLRIIAGFLTPDAGRVLVDGRSIDGLPPNRRDVGIVFQNYALFPHMSVYENVAYGLRARRAPKLAIEARVPEMLDLVHMGSMAGRLPRELSGGQQQRVAVARVLAVQPRILLLDEPFGALDKNLRLDMQIEVKRLQRQFGLTAILVTHDQEEAMSLADRIVVLNRGRIEQAGAPSDIYDRPASLFVNGFVGTANLLPGRVHTRAERETVIDLDAGARVTVAAASPVGAGSRALLTVRPEHIRLAPADNGDGPNRLPGTLSMSLPLGPVTVHDVALAGGTSVKVTEPRAAAADAPPPGSAVRLAIDTAKGCAIFAAEGGAA